MFQDIVITIKNPFLNLFQKDNKSILYGNKGFESYKVIKKLIITP